MSMPVAFVTGVSSGLGFGLAQELIERKWQVFGCSRRGPVDFSADHFHFEPLDLEALTTIPDALARLFGNISRIDLALLNAGHLGQIGDLADENPAELERILKINVVANQALLRALFQRGLSIGQCLAISSGASVNATRGWSGYGVSKAALNMLVALFAAERPDIHFLSLAPGLVDTAMQDYVAKEVDTKQFPGMQRLVDARGTEAMPSPRVAAARILDALPRLRRLNSGAYVDIRKLGAD